MKRQPSALSVGRQKLTILLCCSAYIFLYLCRNGFNANITLLEADYGISHAAAGSVVSLFSLGYAVGQVLNGMFCRFYPRRWVVPLALLGSAAVNLAVYFDCPFSLIPPLWFVNALCCSVMWPMILQVYSENVHADLMPKAMMWLSTVTGIGVLLTYGLSSLLAGRGVYRAIFLIGPIVIAVIAVGWVIGYAPGNYAGQKASEKEKPTAAGRLLLWIPVILLCLFCFLGNAIRDGLQTWVPAILKETHHLPDSFSILLTLVLPLFGMFGAMLALRLNRLIRRFTVMCLCFFAASLALNLVVVVAARCLPVMLLSFGALELVTHGICEVAVAMFPVSMRGKLSSGLLGGVINGCSYLGSAVSSFALGKLADASGWNAVFAALVCTSAVALLVGGLYWLATARKKELRV